MVSVRTVLCAGAIASAVLAMPTSASELPRDRIMSLAGAWSVRLDPEKQGVEQRWFAGPLPTGSANLAGAMRLPGSTDENRLGTPNRDRPTLDGLYRLYKFEGPAWYQRQIEVPAEWRGKRVRLFLERVHWTTRVWVDDREVSGVQDSLIAPHVHNLRASLTPGKHRLTVCVDNTRKLDLGKFVSINYEGTQTNWNGVIGRIELRANDPISIEDVQVFPDVSRKLARVRVTVANATGKAADGTIEFSAADREGGRRAAAATKEVALVSGRTTIAVDLPMGDDVRLWDEFSPALYDLTVSLSAGQGVTKSVDRCSMRFGMRQFSRCGTQFTLNGRPVFLRGTLECAIFPKTGYPATDVAAWRRICRIVKSYGLNHIRFHSWCPPESAFTAADEEGIIVQAEAPQANVDAGVEPRRDVFIEQEMLRMVRTYGNHPSFCLMTLGNEYGEAGGRDRLLSHWLDMLRREESRRLYSSPSSGQRAASRQFTVAEVRGIHGQDTTGDFHERIAKEDRPLLSHEIGQWAFFPDFREIPKYKGVLAAKNFGIVREDLQAKHLLDLAPQYVQACGRQAALLYKEEIESQLRTPQHAGFALLDLHDYPGQGTALVGLLDPFWESKGFVLPEAHRRYCGPTVPLLRMKKRTFTVDETFAAELDVFHYGGKDLVGVQPVLSIKDGQGREIATETLPATDIGAGKLTAVGVWAMPLKKAAAPCKLSASFSLKGTEYANEWDIWVYPSPGPIVPPPGVALARRWNEAKALLAAGRTVVYCPEKLSGSRTIKGSFFPVFWSPVWFPGQAASTMSVLCDPKHPALARFPTESHTNWQWFDLLQNSRSMILDDTPSGFRPVVQMIDNFARNHKLGNMFETRVGRGRLLACSIDLPGLIDRQPAARQLLASLYAYAGSESFTPAFAVDERILETLFAEEVAVHE